MVPETRVFQAADGKDLVMLACTVFDWSTHVTDKQTDRQTDGQNCEWLDYHNMTKYAKWKKHLITLLNDKMQSSSQWHVAKRHKV